MPSPDDIYRHPWEKLASQYLEGLREGEAPDIEELLKECPDDAGEVRELLALVSAMEGWKVRRELSAIRQSMPERFRFDRLGDCRILREIGRGGMGVVFEAEQESMRRRVAVKLLPWRFPKASRLRERFQHEAVLAAKLQHKHIVPVYQFGEQDGWCYYVMHLIPGMGLDRIIRRLRESPHGLTDSELQDTFQSGRPATQTSTTPPVAATPAPSWWKRFLKGKSPTDSVSSVGWTFRRESWNQVARFGMQVADALRYAHANGVLHRDIKPGNLILDARRHLWVADFGLAQLDAREQSNDPDSIAGTLRYTPPEQLAGRPEARSDVYALGITLYELCVLQPAFTSTDKQRLLYEVREVTPPSPQNLNPRCPTELSQIIMQACAKRPEDRFETAAAFSTALAGFLRSRGRSR